LKWFHTSRSSGEWNRFYGHKNQAPESSYFVPQSDFGAAAIHGDKTQQEREGVLSEFKSGKKPVLVATDVAARGLDVKDVRLHNCPQSNFDLVIFLPRSDPPKDIEVTD
jgi:superfamily II DNA/RNA helicase